MTNDKYFAALPTKDFLPEIIKRNDAYYQWLLTSGRLGRWRLAYDSYYGQRGNHNSSYVSAIGDQGEISALMCNEYRSLLQAILVMATKDRPSVECVAVNTDFRSQAQAILGTDILEHYFRERKVENVLRQAMEIALVMDLSYVMPIWDPSLGEDVAMDPDSGQPVKQGDVRATTRTGLDVAFDFTRLEPGVNDWYCIHDFINKYDLAAQRPDRREEIISTERDYSKEAIFRFGDIPPTDNFNTELISRYTFVHARTPALPDGRMTQFLDSEVELFDGPLPFRDLPVLPCIPSSMILSSFGYSNGNDLLSLQDVLDAMISSAATNMTSTGVNNLWSKPNQNFDFEQIASGMNLLESDEKPEVLMLNRMSPEMFSFMEFIIQRMQSVSGVNSVARGDTMGKDLSGAAMALLQSMAIQFNSGVQNAYARLIEDTGSQIISQLQDFGHEERVALVAGKSRGYMTKAFSASKIEKIMRVYVNQSNPYRNTISGRVELAKELLGAQFIKSPEQYIEVLETGRLEPMIEDPQRQSMNIRRENEDLMEGQVVPVIASDDHPKHIQEHKSILDDPEARKDPKLVQNALAHIAMHLKIWSETDPITLQAFGVPPLPPMQGGFMPQIPGLTTPGLPGPGPSGPPGSDAGAGNVLAMPDRQNPNVRMPNFPTNPLTDEEWDPESGGGVV